MSGLRKQFGFYLAILVAFFNATGISASESELAIPDPTPSHETIEAPDSHTYWASEEIFQQTQLPRASETPTSGFGIASDFGWLRAEKAPSGSKEILPFRDLRSSITALIFPFHFFL